MTLPGTTRALRPMRVWAACIVLLPALLGAQPKTEQQSNRDRLVRFPSVALGETRIVHINLPPNYRLAKRRYPVVVLLDGQVRPFFDMAVAATGYSLTGDLHDFAMPAQIVVGVEQGDRSADLARREEAFTRFLTDELLPFLDREYRTVPFRTLIGHSLGGRFALSALCRAPTAFSATIAISPSLADSASARVRTCLRAPTTHQRTLVLSAGSTEARADATVRTLAQFVRDSAPSWRLGLVDGEGQGHTDTPFFAIPQGLRFVFETELWEIDRASADSVLARRGDPRATLTRALATVSARVGFPLDASPKWEEVVVRTQLARGALNDALSSAKRYIERYPDEIIGLALLADAYEAKGDRAAARRALLDALALLEKLEWFDETQRAQQRAYYQIALARITPR
ncbi:MAG: hypothetical protein IT353_22860 [Gemmatimonadaceae bacterium]|nr:hypothetical protein [Gemmatimonadaceae bacterium]